MSKRILIFSLAYHPFVGGAEIALRELTNRLGPDYVFDMVTLRFDRTLPRIEKLGNVQVYRIGIATDKPSMRDLVRWPQLVNKMLFPFMSWRVASRLHRRNSYDAIWAMMANYAGFGAVFFKMSHPNIPFLLTLQEGDPIPEIKRKVKWVYPLFKRIFLRADHVQAISNYLADFARSMGFEGTVSVLPNAVDIARFATPCTSEARQKVRNQFGPTTDTYIITVSRLVKKNGVDLCIRALEYLPQNMRIVIVGTGPDEAELKHLARTIKVEDRVVFAGEVTHDTLPCYLQAADIFTRPSRSEGMGNAFIEAMAAGIPVIATPVGGIVDFLRDPDHNHGQLPTGLFCRTENPSHLAEQILRIASNQELRSTLVRNAQNMVMDSYDWNLIGRRMRQEVFDPLCSAHERS